MRVRENSVPNVAKHVNWEHCRGISVLFTSSRFTIATIVTETSGHDMDYTLMLMRNTNLFPLNMHVKYVARRICSVPRLAADIKDKTIKTFWKTESGAIKSRNMSAASVLRSLQGGLIVTYTKRKFTML